MSFGFTGDIVITSAWLVWAESVSVLFVIYKYVYV